MNTIKSSCLAAILTLISAVPAAAQYYFNPYSVSNAPNFRPYPWANTTPLPIPYNVGSPVSREPAQAQTPLRWWCPAAHAYYPQVTVCQVGTWQAVYPPPTPRVSQLPPPVTGNEQFRCRDANTNFVYERPEPCAKGDETLSAGTTTPSAGISNPAAGSAGPPPTAATVPSSPSSRAFQEGQVDRRAWEAWFDSQSGDFRAGAEYWAAHRSLRNPGSCTASPPSTNASRNFLLSSGLRC
jgi:hypothetical protein